MVAGWKGPLYEKLGSLAFANAVAIVLCLSFLLSRNAELTTWEMMLAYFVAAIPFLFSGTIVSLVIADTIERVNRVYFFDLVGAAAGCAASGSICSTGLAAPTLSWSRPLSFAVSAAIWFHLAGSTRGRVAAVTLGLLLVGLITYNCKFSSH